MQATIAVLATLDTKGPEAAYLRDGLRARELDALIVGQNAVPEIEVEEEACHRSPNERTDS